MRKLLRGAAGVVVVVAAGVVEAQQAPSSQAPASLPSEPEQMLALPDPGTNVRGPLAAPERLMAAGKFGEAESALRAYLDTEPHSGQARYLLAYALLRQNKPKDSLQEYTRAAALQKPTAQQLRSVGQDYVLLEDYPDASKWILRAIQMDPGDADSWYTLGRLRYSEQKYVDAAESFQKALALAPGNAKAETNLGLAYEGLNRTDDAVAAYRQAIAWQDAGPAKGVSEQPYLNLAIVLVHRGEMAEAQQLLVRAVGLAPGDARIHEQLGQVYVQQGNFAKAAESLEAAVRLDPERSNLHFLLGQAYRRLGRMQDAKTQFDAAARLANPTPAAVAK